MLITSILNLLFLPINLFGYNAVGDKNLSLSLIYGITATLSLLLLISYCVFVRKKQAWFILLFSSVLVVNCGYTFLSVSSCLETALMANRISYLGSVFLPFAMLMIILNVTNTKYKKILPIILFCVSILVFFVAASPGILDIYYKEVAFEIVNGVSTLVKVYGPLHPLYLFYLVGYFAAMVTVIIRASIKKTMQSTAHAIILAIAVFVNIGVWFIEQLVRIDFEILSISYIISESFLLGIHLVVSENQKLRELIKQAETVQSFSNTEISNTNAAPNNQLYTETLDITRFEVFISGINDLTKTEKAIFDSYIARLTTKEIMANLNIKENTLKYHNKNIYSKLGVSSRRELFEIYQQVKNIKTNTGAQV